MRDIAFILVIALTGLPFYGHGVTCVVLGLIVLGVLAAYLFNMDKLKEQWEELPPYFVTSSSSRLGRDEVLNYIDEINKSLG